MYVFTVFCTISSTTTDEWSVGEATIDILTDDALLTIFLLCKDVSSPDLSWWQPLVHVCRRWRHVIFASPLHLNLTLVCTVTAPVKKSLNIWPPLPIAFDLTSYGRRSHTKIITAALGRHGPDRVSVIRLENLMIRNFIQLTRAMESPFPALTYLSLRRNGMPNEGRDDDFILRDVFLGGSAPSLRTLILDKIGFPALPKLLLSTTQLVTLQLFSTLGYMSLRVTVTSLAALPNLKQLHITHCPFYNLDRSPSQSRAVLPSLTSFYFHGTSGSLEDFVAQIDTPMLRTLSITLDGVIHIPQLLQFVIRAETLKSPIRVIFLFEEWRFRLKLMPSDGVDGVEFATRDRNSSDQFITMGSLCSALSPLLSHVERLDLHCNPLSPPSQGFGIPLFWKRLFRRFTSVQSLYVSKKVWPRVGPGLRALIGERAAESLPELRTLFLEEPSEEDKQSIESFVAMRRLTIQPCTASDFVAES